jgi:ATP-dependent helicase HrpA
VAAWERVSFGELDLIPRRRVPYGVDNQVEARVIFIRSALVEDQLGVKADFLAHNLKIEDQVNSIARARRQANLLANADRKFQFYDSVVPLTIFNRASFEKWRAVIERRKPEILRMSQSDFFVEPLADSHEAKWPLQLDVGRHVVNVHYQHEPGADADGVTVRVPLLELPDLDCDRLEWLVPGLIAEKIEALIRSLPKRVRARFQPVEAVIQAFLEQHQVGSGSLLELLARELKRASGLEVRVEDFALANMPAHFSARIEVIESDGRVLATGRDAAQLVKKFAAQSDLARREVIARTTNGLPIGKEFAWWIAPLPAVLPMPVNIGHQAGQVRAWAALEMSDGQGHFKSRGNVRHDSENVKVGATIGKHAIDQEVHHDQGVRLRQFATLQEAHESQLKALCELVLQLNHGAIEHHLDFHGEFTAIQSVAGSSSDTWKHQLVVRIAELILLEGKEALPTRDELNQQIESVDKKILGATQLVLHAVAALANEVLALDSELKRPAPASWAPILQDAQSERDDLLRRDWLQDMPLNYLLVASTLIKAHRARVAQLEGAGVLRAQRDQFDSLWKPRLAQERPRRCEASTWSQFKWSVRFARLLPWGAGHGLTPPIRERDLEALWLGVTR